MTKTFTQAVQGLLFLLFFLSAGSLKAYDYYMGGDISYKLNGTDSVSIYITVYRECYYSSTGPSKTVYISTCDTSYSVTASPLYSKDVTPKCSSACTRCQTSSFCTTAIGMSKDVLVAKIKIKGSKCSTFTFSYKDLYRTYSINTATSYAQFYVETKMIKVSDGFHSSPVFTTDPLSYINTNLCVAAPVGATIGTDDSLYYTLTSPLKDKGSSISYNSGYSYQEPVKYYGYPNRYKSYSSSCGGFHLDSLTGMLYFKPTASAVSPMAIMVEQYVKNSKGVYEKACEMTRDMTLNVNSWSTPPTGNSTSTISDILITGSTSIDICDKKTFKIKITSGGVLQSGTFYTLTPIPGLWTSKTTLGKTVTFSFEVTPNKDNIGQTYTLMVDATDETCPIQQHTVKQFSIHVVDSFPPVQISKTYKGCSRYGYSISQGKNPGDTYAWYLDTVILSTDTLFNYKFRKNGTYLMYLTVKRPSGCQKTFVDTITINNILSPDAGNDTAICAGSTIHLNAKGAYFYSWSPATGLSAANIPNPSVTPDKSITYYLTATDSHKCSYRDSVHITVSPFSFTVSKDTVICQGAKASLWASGSPGLTYNWSPATALSDPNADSTFASPTVTTTYTLTATHPYGCTNSRTVTVYVHNPVADAGEDKRICRGDSAQLSASGGILYQWKPVPGISQLNAKSPYVHPDSNQYYTVYVTDSLGCTAMDSVFVDVGYLGSIKATGTTVICAGDSTTVHITGGSTFLWSPAELMDDPTSADPKVFPKQTTYFKVTAFDAKHLCSKTDSVRVRVDADCVWPGDANMDSTVSHFDVLSLGVGFGSTGSKRPGATWKSYSVPNWTNQTAEGVNYKHLDANGDGMLDANDTIVISKFYGYSYGKPKGVLKNKPTDPVLYVHFPHDTLYASDTVTATLYIGSPSKMAKTLYGLSTSMSYNNKWMVPGTFNMNVPCKFPCGNASKLVYDHTTGTSIQLSVVRTDHADSSGYGLVGEIKFVLKDTNAGYAANGEWLSFKLRDSKGVDKFGRDLAVLSASDSVLILRKRKASTLGIGEKDLSQSIKIYPNPARDILFIDHKGLTVGKILIYNMLGEALEINSSKDVDQGKVSLGNLPPNMYFIRIETPEGIWQDKFLIQK